MLNFGGTKFKNAFLRGNRSVNEFQPVNCMHVNSLVHQIEKHSKSWHFGGDRIFTNFSKIAFSETVTTYFENRAKRQAETKSCAFLDIGHKAVPYRASSVHFAAEISNISHTSGLNANN